MKDRKDPETLAREYLACCLRWARRLSRLQPAPPDRPESESTTILEIRVGHVETITIIRRTSILPVLAALALSLSACTGPRPLHGGHALTTAGGTQQSLTQGENASAPSRQTQETIKTRTYTLPAGSLIQLAAPKSDEGGSLPAPPLESLRSLCSLRLTPQPVLVVEREETRAQTELGAAQKDTAREIGAKLASLKGIVWVGLALFVSGLASLFWPPLQVIIGSVTTSAAISLGGVALMVLPTLVVGNELLILGGVVLAVGAWFLAHRHGQLRGQLQSLAAPKSDEGGSPSTPLPLLPPVEPHP